MIKVLVAILATVLSLFVGGVSPAQAAPRPTVVHSAAADPCPPGCYDTSDLSGTALDVYNMDFAIWTKATSGKTIDYKTAKAYSDGLTVQRRKYVAGWLHGGGKVKNISAKEEKKIRAYLTQLATDSIAADAAGKYGIRLANKDECQGKNGVEYHHKKAKHWTLYFLDSCKTADAITSLQIQGLEVGALAYATRDNKLSELFVGLFVAVFAIDAIYWSNAQDKSAIGATYVSIHNLFVTVRAQ